MAQYGPSTRSYLISWEGTLFKMTKVLPSSLEQDIGHGYMLIDPDGKKLEDRRNWFSPSRNQFVDLFADTLSNQETDELLDYYVQVKNKTYLVPFQYNIPALNQDQYDALFDWHYVYGDSFSRNINRNLKTTIGKYLDDLKRGYADIFDVWTKYATVNGVFSRGVYIRRVSEFMLFFGKPVNRSYLDTLTQGAKTKEEAFNKVKGIVFEGKEIPPYNSETGNKSDESIQGSEGQSSIAFDLEKIQANIENLELDNSQVFWGRRNQLIEETDWIGLRQFLIYLCTTYYPQNMVPFAELIPLYSLENPLVGDVFTSEFTSDPNNTDKNKQKENKDINAFSNDFLISKNRASQTSLNQQKLTESGGIDLLTLDPFNEFSNGLNVPNDAQKNLINNRGYGYKIFGNIVLSPSVQDGFISKAGGVGFQNITIETGNEAQGFMPLITIKLVDIQGNKFLDPNSPWSFILNGTNTKGGDFYFRYGWQVRVPEFNKEYWKEDDNARKFWTHEGWKLFEDLDKSDTRTALASISKVSDYTITLTQSSDSNSFRTPGYMLDQESNVFRLDRKLNPFSYSTLTMINPEIAVNSEDASVTATLYFRTSSAVTNFVNPLKNANNIRELIKDTRNNETNLLDLFQAFFKDNKQFLLEPLNNKPYNNNFIVDDNAAEDYIQVIGKSKDGEISVNLDPKNIRIKLNSEQLKELNGTKDNLEDNRLTLTWLNSVLETNDLSPISFGDSGGKNAASDTDGTVVLFYSPSENNDRTKVIEKPNQFNELNLRGVERLKLQDDVFSFRFRGSLVESINLQVIKQDNEQTIKNNQNFASEYGEDNNDLSRQEVDPQSLQVNNQIKELESRKNSNISTFFSPNNAAQNTALDQEITRLKKQIGELSSKNKYKNFDNKVTLSQKKRILNLLLSQLNGVTITALAHPWVKCGRTIGIKGTGTFDGKYIVTKVKHEWNEDNKFISEINAFRIRNAEDYRKKLEQSKISKETLQNNPSLKASEKFTPKIITAERKTLSLPVSNEIIKDNLVINKIIPNEFNKIINKNKNFAKKFFLIAYDEYKKNVSEGDLNWAKYVDFMNLTSTNRTLWCASFVSWCAYTASVSLNDIIPFNASASSMNIKEQFQSKGLFYPAGSSYVPKQGDLAFFTRGTNETSGHISIVSSLENGTLKTIDGNYTNKISFVNRTGTFSTSTSTFLGYGSL